jgi:hypothetical protein
MAHLLPHANVDLQREFSRRRQLLVLRLRDCRVKPLRWKRLLICRPVVRRRCIVSAADLHSNPNYCAQDHDAAQLVQKLGRLFLLLCRLIDLSKLCNHHRGWCARLCHGIVRSRRRVFVVLGGAHLSTAVENGTPDPDEIDGRDGASARASRPGAPRTSLCLLSHRALTALSPRSHRALTDGSPSGEQRRPGTAFQAELVYIQLFSPSANAALLCALL